jgi:hypothetical protein
MRSDVPAAVLDSSSGYLLIDAAFIDGADPHPAFLKSPRDVSSPSNCAMLNVGR